MRARSCKEKRFLETLERTVRHVRDIYEVGMSWREGKGKFPDNRLVAEKRLSLPKGTEVWRVAGNKILRHY